MKHDFLQIASKSFISYLSDIFQPFADNIDSVFPIFINNTGDEVFLSNMAKGIKTETIYSSIPRMSLDVKNISILFDQLSSNKIEGSVTVQTQDGFPEKIKLPVRRMPLTLTLDAQIVFNNIFEYFLFVEIFLTISHHNHMFSFVWGGSQYSGTFLLQDDLSSDANMVLLHDSDKRSRKMQLTFVLYLQYPAFDYYEVGQHQGLTVGNKLVKMHKITHNMHVNDESSDGIVSTIDVTKTNL